MSSASSRSGSRTPKSHPNASLPSQSAASYFSYPVSHVVSGLYRRLTDQNSSNPHNAHDNNVSTTPGVFTPRRTASPFQPPPLTPLTLTISDLNHESESTSLQQQHLTRALAEEIRLLVPARLQLVDTWRLAYSLDRDGASLSTLFANCRDFAQRSPRAGFVLVVRDASPNGGAMFGAYMTDPPHPDSHYYGTGECFLWRASVLPPPNKLGLGIGQMGAVAGGGAAGASGAGSENLPPEMLELAGLPPPPSADTTNAGRSTTLRGDSEHSHSSSHTTTSSTATNNLIDFNDNTNTPTHLTPLPPQPPRSQNQTPTNTSGTSTPERIRFKAFPYSGVNDYMMFCETGFLSLGGG